MDSPEMIIFGGLAPPMGYQGVQDPSAVTNRQGVPCIRGKAPGSVAATRTALGRFLVAQVVAVVGVA